MRHMAALRRPTNERRPRRDVLPGLGALSKRVGALRFTFPDGRGAVTVRPGLPEPGRKAPAPRRFTGRARSILTTAAIAAVLANAGAAWTYWLVTDANPRPGGNGPAIQMALSARSDPNVPPAPGGRSDLLVTLINNHDFPVRITSVTAGPGRVVADHEHRDAGCTDPVIALTRERFPVRWDVPKNTIGAFTIPNGLVRASGGSRACDGAVFTVPVRATGAGHGF